MTDRARFDALGREGCGRVPVAREVLADTDTPLGVYLKLGRGPHSYFFESVQGGEKWGRYSIIGLPCRTVLRARGGEVRVETDGETVETARGADPFAFIERFLARRRTAPAPGGGRFAGGLVGYFAYDTARLVEPSLPPPKPAGELDTPDILLMLSEEVVVFDNLRGTLSLVVHADPAAPGAWDAAQARLDELVRALAAPAAPPPRARAAPGDGDGFRRHFAESDYRRAVSRIKDRIAAGDVMQVVLSQRMSAPFAGDPLDVYRALRHLNPSPHMVFFDLGDHHVASASPEILARLEAGRITVRPLAGTRRRGADEAEDLALERELLADEKELAEHLMLIDLGRNDSGRVSRTGSVTVPRRMFVERYSHVMHIASIVESEIREGLGALDVLKATLPAGTLSGAPKLRAMEIIDELEPERRGVYGGAMGYLGWNGNMDMAIAIRTAVVAGGRLYVQAGAGIVADSDPAREWEETCSKARAVVRAVELARGGLAIG